jgi:hypothetical protein
MLTLTLIVVLLYVVPGPKWLQFFAYVLGGIAGIQACFIVRTLRKYYGSA